MQPSPDHTDEFFLEQVRQLQTKGHSPEAAAEIVANSMSAVSDALGKLLERIETGEPIPELDRFLGDSEQAKPAAG